MRHTPSHLNSRLGRCKCRFVWVAKKPSTALSQEPDVGVKTSIADDFEPSAEVGLFVSGVGVDDVADDFSSRDGALNGVEEVDELLVAMPPHAASDHGSVEEVERGE